MSSRDYGYASANTWDNVVRAVENAQEPLKPTLKSAYCQGSAPVTSHADYGFLCSVCGASRIGTFVEYGVRKQGACEQ